MLAHVFVQEMLIVLISYAFQSINMFSNKNNVKMNTCVFHPFELCSASSRGSSPSERQAGQKKSLQETRLEILERYIAC